MVKYIADEQHYKEVLALVSGCKESLAVGTADLKDLYIDRNNTVMPFLGVVAGLLQKGVVVDMLHAKEPGPNFREDFDQYLVLSKMLRRKLCPRVHFKILIFDEKTAYIGSANLTGAGIGMKGKHSHNFEAGILTDEPDLGGRALEQFYDVFTGKCCSGCRRRDYCPDPIISH